MESYRNITISQQLKETAQRFPERTAVSYPGRRLTYAELDEFSDRTAQAFLSCGIKKGSHVALFSANVPELVLIFHALWKIGAVVIPLCTAYSAQEQQYALQRSDAEHLILIGRPVNGNFAVPREDMDGIRVYTFREPDDLIDFIAMQERIFSRFCFPIRLAFKSASGSGTLSKTSGAGFIVLFACLLRILSRQMFLMTVIPKATGFLIDPSESLIFHSLENKSCTASSASSCDSRM